MGSADSDALSSREIDKVLSLFKKNEQTVLNTYSTTESVDGMYVEVFCIECDNSNALHVGGLMEDLRGLEKSHDIGYERNSNGNGFYGYTWSLYHYAD